MADFPCFYQVRCRLESTLKCCAWVFVPSVSGQPPDRFSLVSRGTATQRSGAITLWHQHTRVYDQDDEGCNVRGKGFQVDQIKTTRQFLKTFYPDVTFNGVEVNLPIPHTNTFTNELV